MQKKSGFTLVELMVVIAIIAILAFAGFRGVGYYLAKGRDTIRKEDARAIRSAITVINSNEGTYPDQDINTQLKSATGKQFRDPIDGAKKCKPPTTSRLGTLNPNIKTSCQYTYQLCRGGNGYMLSIPLETEAYVLDTCVSPSGTYIHPVVIIR